MAGKAPRPNKNSNGQQKKPAANPTGGAAAAAPPSGPPSLVPPGGPPSIDQIAQAKQMQADAHAAMAQQAQQAQADQQGQAQQQQAQLQQAAQQHQQAMQMQQLKGDQALQQGQQAQQTPPGEPGPAQGPPPAPAQAPAAGGASSAPPAAGPPAQAPPGADQGIAPSQWQNNQVREGINFKDLPPMGQAQAEEQEGINPAAPLQMIQSQLQSSLAEPGGPQQPQSGPVPASFSGPMTPPGVENFPHDMAALTQVMQRGFSPGADNGEHEMALNAHAMAKAAAQKAQGDAAQGAQQDSIHQALGGLMQHLQMSGQLPHPADVAAHVQRHAGASPLTSSY